MGVDSSNEPILIPYELVILEGVRLNKLHVPKIKYMPAAKRPNLKFLYCKYASAKKSNNAVSCLTKKHLAAFRF